MNIEIINGTVTNDGEIIGTIKEDICTSAVNIPPVIRGAINKEMGRKLTFIVNGEVEQDESENQPIKLDKLTDEELAAELKRRGIVLPAASSAELKSDIPPPPAQHPAMGDKDPAYVEWFRKHHSEDEFNAKYHDGRKLPTMAEFAKGEQKSRGKLQDEKTDKGE